MNAILSLVKNEWRTSLESAPPHSLPPHWLLRLAQRHTQPAFDRYRIRDTKVLSCLNQSSAIPATTKSLLQRISENERGAMEECIQLFSGLVWNLVKRRVASQSAAEDLVQEIFTEIWKSAGRFDPSQGTETTFIGMIARRRTIDWTRKQMSAPALEPLPDQIDEVSAAEASPASDEYDRERVQHAVSQLSEQTRQLFHLHFDQGLTQQEIAACTELPLGTVKSILRRGLLEARSILLREPTRQPMIAD